jgi:hypothetical protein
MIDLKFFSIWDYVCSGQERMALLVSKMQHDVKKYMKNKRFSLPVEYKRCNRDR